MRKLLSCIMALLIVCSLPVSALAAEYDLAEGSVTVTATGSGQTVTHGSNGPVQDSAPVIIQTNSETSTSNTVTINADTGATANVTLDGVNIDTSGTYKAAVEIKGEGDVVIELDGSNTVQSGWEYAGVEKNTIAPWGTNPGSGNGNLTITDENETHGSLKATGGDQGAGIGGGLDRNGSNITITGNAEVIATGGRNGAGIGGGEDSDGSNITISGNAEVIATGGDDAAGIGGGSGCGDGSYITIEGNAQVTAKGGNYGAGIGGGESCDGSNITISGSAEVTATGGKLASGIGGGMGGDGSDITISGSAEVTAKGGARGSGIGGGGNWGKGSNITVSEDAQVKAQGGEAADNPATGAAIGDGVQYKSDIPGREETPNTDALNKGWIATYTPGTTDLDTANPDTLTYKDDNGNLATSSNAVPILKQKPTCTEDGHRAGFTVGNTLVGGETLPATGHNVPNGYTPQNDATCTTLGTMKGYCTNCQTTVTVPDPNSTLKDHTFTTYTPDPDNPATCTGDGLKTAVCDVCHKATDTVTDPAKGHSFTNYVYNDDAKCGQDGTKTANCDHGCGTEDTIVDVGSALEHSFTDYNSNKDATYDHDGTKTAVCDNGCGATDTIPDPGSQLVREESAQPLYRVLGQDGKALACKEVRKDGVLTITVDADFASLSGTLSGMKTLKAYGIDTIVFVTKGARSSFALSDLLAQGSTSDSFCLIHDCGTVTFTVGKGETDVTGILAKP
ncbi:MAG: hypothetical protein ACI3V5_02650 [Faecousia sp.]